MANSRANIYPVQLQGAELNLNKLDAEIKQYSGFNKNNSPFVGGCLSNIFTKEMQMPGGNADNIFVDYNGDIYRVDETGLYKNDTLIFAKEGEALEQVEVKLPSNLVCLYNEDVYITREPISEEYPLGYYIFHCGNYEDVIVPDNIPGTSYKYFYSNKSFDIGHIYDETLGDVYIVAYQARQGGTSTFILETWIYTKDVEGNFNKSFLYRRETNLANIEDTIGKVCIFPLSNKTGFFVSGYNILKNGVIFQNNTWSLCSFYTNNDSEFSYSYYKKNYYGHIVCGLSNFSSAYVINHVTDIYYDEAAQKVRCTRSTSGLDNVKIERNGVVTEDYNTFKTHYGKNSILKQDNSGTYKYLSFNDGFSILSKAADDRVIVNVGYTIGGIYLVNNNLVSGLSFGGTVLLTEWNTIDPKGDLVFYFYDRKEMYYQNITTNKWYKVFVGVPKISLKYNQIVTNFNQVRNAYSLSRQQIVVFASAFNNRNVRTSSSTHNFTEITDNRSYVAYSINEYNLEDNASIIINPVPVMGTFTAISYAPLELNKDDVFYNVYANVYPNTEITYRYSFTINVNYYPIENNVDLTRIFGNEDLKGLPFPSDTNGNIQYSPSLFTQLFSSFGNDVFIKENDNTYQLMVVNNKPVMSFYLGTLVEGMSSVFILQGQYYGIINEQIFNLQFSNGVLVAQTAIVSVEGLQFVGNTPYEALFFSKTNRCLFSFTGANVLTQKQFIDKISEVKDYLYNPATQTVFLITDIGVLFYGLFGQFLLEYPDISKIFLLQNGIVMSNNSGDYRYIKYYLDESDTDFVKENIRLETCFYGMNNQTVTINDCLYMRIFSEEHEEGDLEVSATTLSLKGRMTEKTTFRIKERDWDKLTHTIYLRYQPKEQRGLGISFSINSPFKIASLSIGSQADAILIDKVSKGAINAPQRTSNNVEW